MLDCHGQMWNCIGTALMPLVVGFHSLNFTASIEVDDLSVFRAQNGEFVRG